MPTRTTAAAVVLITRFSRAIYRLVDDEQLGMSLKQFGMLNILREEGAISQSALSDLMAMDANMVVLLLNGLEERGFAVRERDPHDRRRHSVRATPAGLKALVKGERALEAVSDEALGPLDADERTALRDLLAKAMGDSALAVDEPSPDA